MPLHERLDLGLHDAGPGAATARASSSHGARVRPCSTIAMLQRCTACIIVNKSTGTHGLSTAALRRPMIPELPATMVGEGWC